MVRFPGGSHGDPVAFVLFLVVKAYNAMKQPVSQEPPGPSEIDLLIEIRDSLRK